MVLTVSVLTVVETEQDGSRVQTGRDDHVEDLGLIEVLFLLEHSHEDGQVERLNQVTPLEHNEDVLLVYFPLAIFGLRLGRLDCLHLVDEEHRDEECYMRDKMTLGY